MKNDHSAPTISDFTTLTLPGQTVETLDNGIILHTIQSGGSPANRISILWNYGAAKCPHSYAYKLVPEMMKQGTQHMTGAEIVDSIDYLGAFLGHTAETHWSSFDAMSLSRFTPRLLEILRDIILNPTFPADKFEALKRKALAAYDIQHTRTAVVASEHLENLVAGPGHPYALKPSRARLEELSLDDVVHAWQEGVFKSDIHIFAAGHINESLYEHLKKFAMDIRPNQRDTTPLVIAPYEPSQPGLRNVVMPDSVQSSIAMAIPAIPRQHPDYIPLRIAVTALGGYFGSRLMTVVRETMGMTYGISASLNGCYEGASIIVTADCDPSYVKAVVKQIGIEMHRLADSPLPDDEFRRLRSYYMTTLASVLETFRTVSDYYQGHLTVGTPPDYFEAQQQVLSTITPNLIQEISRKYFRPELAITVIAGKE